MENFLSDADYHVLSADSGDEAMELCRNYEGTIHLLVTDVEQASGSGWELAQTAARIRPGLIVLFVSKETMETGDMRRSVGGPFNPTVLLQVTQALSRKAQQSRRCN
jgi:DNA-binding response OmpR family regulator